MCETERGSVAMCARGTATRLRKCSFAGFAAPHRSPAFQQGCGQGRSHYIAQRFGPPCQMSRRETAEPSPAPRPTKWEKRKNTRPLSSGPETHSEASARQGGDSSSSATRGAPLRAFGFKFEGAPVLKDRPASETKSETDPERRKIIEKKESHVHLPQ